MRLSLALIRNDSLNQRLHVKDQRYLAVAQNSRAADAGKPLKQPAKRLDYCLRLAHEHIDYEAGSLAGAIHYHDVLAFGGFVAHLRTILDDNGRPMVLINWNTDMGDGWEWSNVEDYPGYIKYTALAYRMAINEIVYSLTH